MRRRDALSEKKRERLMQEHEQLQKLMLQARSSVRRSSLKDQPEQHTLLPEETGSTVNGNLENTPEVPKEYAAEKPVEKDIAKKEPLTEKDLFPINSKSSESETKRPPLTEKDLFPESATELTQTSQPQKGNIVKVILPDHNVAASVAHRNTAPEETEDRYTSVIHVNNPVQGEHVEPAVEENDIDYNADLIIEKRTRPKTGYLILLIVVVLLAGFGGYYFNYKYQEKRTSIAPPNNTPVSKSTAGTQPEKPKDSVAVQNINAEKPDLIQTPNKDKAVTANAAKPQVKEPVSEPKKETEPPATASGDLGQYKVISKAYFHDAPDESTRRKAFIVHWNNAVLKPLDEKNGFVYVIFTNHLGQTSKGWLRKQDLKRIDE